MSAGWLPGSACSTACLPRTGEVPRVPDVAAAARLAAAVLVLAVGLVVLPLTGGHPWLVRAMARALLAALGVRHALVGRLPRRGALVVANHVSWLDVVVLVAHAPVRLLAKREVRGWPLIGRLAAACGTLLIDRARLRSLPATVAEVAGVLRAGGLVAAFPEGTTWCGRAGGEFRPAMFQAAVDAGAPVVPVTLSFLVAGRPTTVAAFVGDDPLWRSLRRVAASGGLRVQVRAHPALYPAPGASRRTLARAAASVVRGDRLGSAAVAARVGAAVAARVGARV